MRIREGMEVWIKEERKDSQESYISLIGNGYFFDWTGTGIGFILFRLPADF
jgi:hypothetical protein